jgi:RNA polymerase sigma factor (sigma-70 family)
MQPSGTPIQPQDLRAHASFLRALARRLVVDEHRAEDLVQDTWVAALEHPPRNSGSLAAWLARVARNLAANARRGEARHAQREQRAAREEAQPSAEQALEGLELSRVLSEHVLCLGEAYRTTLYLRYYEGLSHKEIAERLNVPERTVRSRLSRALAELRVRLDRGHGGREAWLSAFLPLLPPLGAPARTRTLLLKAKWGGTFAAVFSTGLLLWFVATSPPPAVKAEPVAPATSQHVDRSGSRWTPATQPLAAARSQVPLYPSAPLHDAASQPSGKPSEGWRTVWDTSAEPMLDVGPRGLAIGPNHEVYVVDYGARSIRVYDKHRPGIARTREIDHFSGLAYNEGHIFAARPRGGLSVFDVWTLEPIGEAKLEDPGGHWLVNSLCVDSSGNVHVLSSADGVVHVFDPSPRALRTWEAGPNARTLCAAPGGLILVASHQGQATTIDFLSVAEPDQPPDRLPVAAEFDHTIVDMCVAKERLYIATEREGVFEYECVGDITERAQSWALVSWLPPGAGLTRSGPGALTHIAVDVEVNRIYVAYGHPDGIIVALETSDAQHHPASELQKQGQLLIRQREQHPMPGSRR